jgi:hypothetical protein
MKQVMCLMAVASLFAATVALADEPVQVSNVFSKYKLTIGGYTKVEYVYNSNQQQPSNYTNLATPDNGGITPIGIAGDSSTMGVEAVRLWFKVDGPGIWGGKSSAFIEGDFFGVPNVVLSSPDFRLRHAYGTLDWDNGQLLFGQTWELFGGMVANTVDLRSGEGYGTPWQREPMIKATYIQKFDADNSLSHVVAVVMPQQTGDNSALMANSGVAGALGTNWSTLGAIGVTQAPVNTNMPNLEGQLTFKSKSIGYAPCYLGAMKELNLMAFGLYGHARYDYTGFKNGSMDGEDSWGGGLYAFVPILASKDIKNRTMTASLEAQIYEASNMVWNGGTAAPFTQVGAGQIYGNAVGDAATITPMKDLGIAAQLIFYPTQEMGLTVGFTDRIAANKSSDFAGVAQYNKSDSMIYTNLTYDLNAAVRVAAEYENVMTTYGSATGNILNKTTGVDNIGRFAMYYFF